MHNACKKYSANLFCSVSFAVEVLILVLLAAICVCAMQLLKVSLIVNILDVTCQNSSSIGGLQSFQESKIKEIMHWFEVHI